jgi:putative hydrolase of the HAD superfamily
VSEIRGVISDFGGVLTNPLAESFVAMQKRSGISLEALGNAMVRVYEEDGAHPLFELETGRLSEHDFLTRLGGVLSEELGRPVALNGFGAAYFAELAPNDAMIEEMRALRSRGYRMALLTNNVREWQPLWRPMLPVDEIFEVLVDSGFVGMRKPDAEIYELTLERLRLPAAACLFVDDTEVNCEAARALGMSAVHFRDTEQALEQMAAALDGERPSAQVI